MKPKIFVTRRLPEGAMQVLENNFEVACNPHDRVLTRQELFEGAKGMDGLLPLLTDRIDDEVFAAAGGQLKIVANYAVGFNNFDLAAGTARKIPMTNTPGVLTDTTADLAMALLLGVARRVVPADAYARAGKYEGWAPLLFVGSDVHRKTLGILGFGRIGYAMAKRAAGFDMRVLYTDAQPVSAEIEHQVNARFVDKDTLLKESDFISVHVPLTPETRHILKARDFALMKKDAYVINTARGEVIHEQDLVDALKAGQIGGAGLDVFEHEPTIHPDLMGMDNVIILPHIASASIETRTRMGLISAENLIAVLLRGQRPPNVLNPEIYG
jgi:glyoxylate reductase